MEDRQARRIGAQVTDTRRILVVRANESVIDNSKTDAEGSGEASSPLKSVAKIAKKIEQRGRALTSKEKKIPGCKYMDPVPIALRKRRRKGHNLKLDEKLDIVHKAMILNEMHGDLAKEYRVTQPCISSLVSRARKNPKFINELLERRDMKAARNKRITEAVI